jgi:hypothetical protein
MTAGMKPRPDHRTTMALGTATVGGSEREKNKTGTTMATTPTAAASNCLWGGNGDRTSHGEDAKTTTHAPG